MEAKTGLPLYYLDMIWHRADRTVVDFQEFDEKLEKILAVERWIIDGNYLRTLPLRLDYADTVFFFDLPLEVCLSGAEERLGKPREDMPWHDDKLDEDFRQWILDFPYRQLPVIKLLLDTFSGKVIRFKTRREADEFISGLR